MKKKKFSHHLFPDKFRRGRTIFDILRDVWYAFLGKTFVSLYIAIDPSLFKDDDDERKIIQVECYQNAVMPITSGPTSGSRMKFNDYHYFPSMADRNDPLVVSELFSGLDRYELETGRVPPDTPWAMNAKQAIELWQEQKQRELNPYQKETLSQKQEALSKAAWHRPNLLLSSQNKRL